MPAYLIKKYTCSVHCCLRMVCSGTEKCCTPSNWGALSFTSSTLISMSKGSSVSFFVTTSKTLTHNCGRGKHLYYSHLNKICCFPISSNNLFHSPRNLGTPHDPQLCAHSAKQFFCQWRTHLLEADQPRARRFHSKRWTWLKNLMESTREKSDKHAFCYSCSTQYSRQL